MSEVFKTFEKDDIQVRGFSANKSYDLTLSDYSASYLPDQPVLVGSNQIVPAINGYVGKADRFSEFNSGSEDLNSVAAIPSRSVWDNLWHMYYRDWPNHGQVFCTSGDSREHRELYDTAYVISVPHYIYGQQLHKGSVELSFTSNAPSGATHTINLKDDGFGNLYNSAYATSSGNTKDLSVPPNEGTVVYLPFKDLTPYQYMPSHGKGYLNQQLALGSIQDFSMYQNKISSNRVKVITGSYYGTGIEFTGKYGDSTTIATGSTEQKFLESWSYAKIDPDYAQNDQVDFIENEDFAVCFYLKVNASQYSGSNSFPTSTILSHVIKTQNSESFIIGTDANDLNTGDNNSQYPFKIYFNNSNGHLCASRKDGSGNVGTCIADGDDIRDGVWRHIIFQKSGSDLDLYVNYSLNTGDHGTMVDSGQIRNQNPIILGGQQYSLEGITNPTTNTRPSEFYMTRPFGGQMDEFRIYSGSLSSAQINYMSASSGTGQNHWGNVFYEHGQIVLTHPSSSYISKAPRTANVKFRNTTRITENLFTCEAKASEYNQTFNPSTISNHKTKELHKYTNSNTWTPYITRIGLYNDAGELLVIGSLAQPIQKMVDYDMSFVVRFDT
tara:strand:+ start:1292 stop:3121 length:1830 start_codon:yes stop_codon:yes gene_type:complete